MTTFMHLTLNNFLSYRKLELNLEDISYASVVGENGAGKSAIPQGIAWLIYGAARFGNSMDSIVNDSAKTASGILVLRDRNGQVWKIERSWTVGKGGGGGLELYQEDSSDPDGWVKFGDKLKDTAQKQINSIIGLTKDAFYSLVLMDQSKYPGGTAFTVTDSNKRREILMSLVPELAVYRDLEVAARARLRAATKEYESFQAKIDLNLDQIHRSIEREDALKFTLEEFNIKSIEKERADLEKKIQIVNQAIGAAGTGKSAAIQSKIDAATAQFELDINNLEREADKIDAALVQHEEKDKLLGREREKMKQLKSKLEDAIISRDELTVEVNEIKGEVSALVESVERVEPKVAAAKNTLAAKKSALAELEDRLDALSEQHGEGECWVCGSELSEEKHGEIVRSVVQQRDDAKDAVSELKEDLDTLLDRMDGYTEDLVAARKELEQKTRAVDAVERDIVTLKEQIEDSEDVISEMMQVSLSDAEVDELDQKLVAIEKDIKSKKREFESVTIKVLKDELAAAEEGSNVEALKEQLEILEQEMTDVVFRKEKFERSSSLLEEAERNTANLNKESKRLNRESQGARDKVARLTKLVHATSPKGIPSILLDSILAAIEDEQNRILASLSQGDQMTVEFSQERENKGEGSKEVLDIIVHTEDGTARLYESFSFGERVRLSISNLFAMIRVFNERSGGLVNTLFLDEPLGPLDKSKIPAFIEILRVAMNEGVVDSIFVITHDDRVIEALPQRITVSIDPETKVSEVSVL